jgi:hypothetical protein
MFAFKPSTVRLLVAITIVLTGADRTFAQDPTELKITSKQPADFLSSSSQSPRSRPYLETSYLSLINPNTTSDQIKAIFGEVRPAGEDRLGAGDFYTFLKLDNYFNDDLIFAQCSKSGDKWFLSLNLKIDYQPLKGSQLIGLVPDSVILLNGNNAGEKGVSRGCTFKSMNLRQTGPYILYAGFGDDQGEYIFHFNATTGSTSTPSGLAMFTKLALAVVGALPGLTIAPGVGPAVATLAGTLDTLIDRNSSFLLNSQYSAALTTKKQGQKEYITNQPWNQITGPHLSISSPYLDRKHGNKATGYFEAYQGRSASIVLDSSSLKIIKGDDILSNPGLGVPHNCVPGFGSCGKDASFFAKAGGASISLDTNADLTTTAQGTKDKLSGAENWSKIFSACQKIRETASDLGLSTIDKLVVRWALVQRAGLYELLKAFQDPLNPKYDAAQTAYKPAVDAAAKLGRVASMDECWSAQDTLGMKAIEEVMGKMFVSSSRQLPF